MTILSVPRAYQLPSNHRADSILSFLHQKHFFFSEDMDIKPLKLCPKGRGQKNSAGVKTNPGNS
jgi:hypothetical protein